MQLQRPSPPHNKMAGAQSSSSTSDDFRFSDLSLEPLRQQVAAFAKERDWEQFHTPRNLLLAMVGEVGELSEIFQWRGEVAPGLPGWKDKDKVHLGEEMADVFIYLLRLAGESVEIPSRVCCNNNPATAAKPTGGPRTNKSTARD